MGCIFSRNNRKINNKSTEKTILILEKHSSHPQEIPPELLTLLHQNKIEIQKKFYDVLNRNPSDTDGIGFIYGFTKDNDYKWIKIGRTIHANPNKRVDEWKG